MRHTQNIIIGASLLAASATLVSGFTPHPVINAISIPSRVQSSPLCSSPSTLPPMRSRLTLTLTNQRSTISCNRKTLTSLSLFGFDNKEKTDVQNSNVNADTILQRGGMPTIVIEPEDTSDAIYDSAIKRTLAWVAAAAAFGSGLYLIFGSTTAEEFFAGYLLEQSLSIDNVLVFLLLFDYFKVPLASQDRVLNFGIYGAFVMRAIMIGLGSVALYEFHGVLLVFAGILLYSSATVLLGDGDDDEDEDMSENAIVALSKNLFDSSDNFDGDRFFTIEEGIKKATPLFICMIAVEISDVVFAVDSIPAVFGVTENPLVVFTSNMFAIMGLRSLYTILSKAASDLEYLEPAVAVVLGFVGGKLIGEYFGYQVPTVASLGVVITMLSGGVGASLYKKRLVGEEA